METKRKKGIAPPRYDEAFKAGRSGVSVEKLCRLLEISRSGYYAWLTRRQSQRAQHNQALTRELVYLHENYPGQPVSHVEG